MGSAAILAFLTAVSPIMHDLWTATQPGQRMNETVNSLKNIALAGGAMALMGVEEPWPASLSGKARTHPMKRRLRKIAA